VENAGVSGFLFFFLLAFICGQIIEGTCILFLSVTLLIGARKYGFCICLDLREKYKIARRYLTT
jgi:hypothetical protein